MMSESITVSNEFLAEEKQQLNQTMPKSKKNGGGPFPIHARKIRRDEVFKLHFDYGYSARKIADKMKISRNTINADVNYWYSRLEKEFETSSTDACLAKIVNRLESQRSRLRENLDKATNIQEKIAIDRMVLDIDNRLIQFYLKTKTTDDAVYDLAVKRLNEWMKEKKYDHKIYDD